MTRIAEAIARGIPRSRIRKRTLPHNGTVNKLIVRTDNVQVKIEVTPVLRGCVYEPEFRAVTEAVTEKVEEAFGFAEMQLVSFADLFAGKFVDPPCDVTFSTSAASHATLSVFGD